MRTIEVYSLLGDKQTLICAMWFLTERSFQEMISSLVSSASGYRLPGRRHKCYCIQAINNRGFQTKYYADSTASEILCICTDYQLIFNRAIRIAKKRSWVYAWEYSTPAWRHRTILKFMARAKREIEREQGTFFRIDQYTDGT
jgi:hypothetical protein